MVIEHLTNRLASSIGAQTGNRASGFLRTEHRRASETPFPVLSHKEAEKSWDTPDANVRAHAPVQVSCKHISSDEQI